MSCASQDQDDRAQERAALIGRLDAITPGCTTTVRDVVVTRCSNDTFEIATWGVGPFLTIEQAADQLRWTQEAPHD